MYKTYSDDSVLGRAHALYDSTLKSKVETPENVGKFILIDVEGGDFEIGHDAISIYESLKARRGGIIPVMLRIGYETTFRRGYGRPPKIDRNEIRLLLARSLAAEAAKK